MPAKNQSINVLEAIEQLHRADPVLAPLIDQFDPYPVQAKPTQDDLFAGLAKAILYQSISVKAANTVCNRLQQQFPSQNFPTAADMLNTPDTVLRSIGIPPFKVLYLKEVAQATLNGLPPLSQLAQMDDVAIVRLLTQIKGIGLWSVQMLLIFQLKRLDVLPVADLGIRAAIRDLYGLPELPNRATVEAISTPWKPYRTIACWYLWHSRDEAARQLLKLWI